MENWGTDIPVNTNKAKPSVWNMLSIRMDSGEVSYTGEVAALCEVQATIQISYSLLIIITTNINGTKPNCLESILL